MCQEKTHIQVVVVRFQQEAEAEVILGLASEFELAGVEERADSLVIWPAHRGEAAALARSLSRWRTELEEVEDRNWNEVYQQTWTPLAAGERFYLVPPGDTGTVPAGRLRLEMHAGMAFGNGDHPTTHLCLMAMEEGLHPGDRFLDVGCGSGLLAEAARLLGAGFASGCDLDAAVVRAGSFAGSTDAVRSGSCDYVVANIQLGVLRALLPDIARILRPGGEGVLAGVTRDQVTELRETVEAAGLVWRAGDALGEWESVRISRNDRGEPCATL